MPPGEAVENEIEQDDLPPLVTVFGAGITGLSAAHELIERGFRVQVVEKDESQLDEYECRVGGMAANQLSRVPASIKTLHPELYENGDTQGDVAKLRFLRARRLLPTQRRIAIKQRIRFAKGPSPFDWKSAKDEHGTANQTKLNDVLELLRKAHESFKEDYDKAVNDAEARIKKLNPQGSWIPLSPDVESREILLVEIRGFTDTDDTAQINRKLSHEWAKCVRDELLKMNSMSPAAIPDLEKHLRVAGLGDSSPVGDQRAEASRARSNRVEFHVVEQVIPGEHGFRFFPSFYRHLFDTMRRTPVLDERGNETTERAFDQLVPTPDASIALEEDDKPPLKLDTRRIRSLRDVQQLLEIFLRKLRLTDRDILLVQLAMLRYMTSCRDRRQRECEDRNFWEYIGGDDAGFTKDAEDFMDHAPKALAAMSAKETDARTQLSIVVQMLVKSPLSELIDDMTLNNSSSEAWFRVWKAYLRQKGVKFFVGSLDGMKLDPGVDGQIRFLPIVSGPGDWMHPRPEDVGSPFKLANQDQYFLVALPFEAVSSLAWKTFNEHVSTGQLSADEFEGPFRQLMRFDIAAKRRSELTGDSLPRKRDPASGAPDDKDPLRDISGIQYFFPNYYRFGHGHVYFLQSQWALTSISQLAYWRDRTDPIGSFIGQNSVDIGDWYKKDTDSGKTAWRSDRQEIAEATWKQIKNGLDRRVQESVIDPLYYHLDHGIDYVSKTFVGYLGNAVIRVGAISANTRYRFVVHNSDYAGAQEISVTETSGNPETVATRIVDKLNVSAGGNYVFAMQTGAYDIVASPFTRGSREPVVISVRGPSNDFFAVKIGSAVFVAPPGRPETVAEHLRSTISDGGFSVQKLDGSSNLLLETSEPVAVVNADNMIEILDGPQLKVDIENRDLELIRRPERSSSRGTQVIATRQAVVQVPSPEAGRTYRITVSQPGWDSVTVEYPDIKSEDRDHPKSAEELREGLIDKFLESLPAIPWLDVAPVRMQSGDIAEISFSTTRDAQLDFIEIEAKDLAIGAVNPSLALHNETPFLINVPGQWRSRSGLSRKPASATSIVEQPGEIAEFCYYHSSPVLEHWVLAGTFMATHTRMTTMEAANESARHAVNAILDRIRAMTNSPSTTFAGKLVADPCEIWDPENNELDDFDYFKGLDEALCSRGLPHLFDILRLADMLKAMPTTKTGRLELWDEIQEFVDDIRIDQLGQLGAGGKVAYDSFENLIRELRAILEPKS
ncbi:MAG: NAD(P)-binding protein [Gammaproteobacteria bacterium]